MVNGKVTAAIQAAATAERRGPRRSTDGHDVRLFDAGDMDSISVRLKECDGVLTPGAIAELRDLVQYASWLYAKRGMLVELLEAHAASDPHTNIESIYRAADWQPEDRYFVAWDRVDSRPNGRRCRYWGRGSSA